MIQAWPRLASQLVFDAGLFNVTRERTRSPRTGATRDVHVVHIADWLMTVALTASGALVFGALVFVRQYRYGSRRSSLEIPGGLHDRKGERPEEGAIRELAEETGYGDGELISLGTLHPQPALPSNRAHIYFARGVRVIAPPQPDAGEDIEVVLVDPCEVPDRIGSAEINNAMTVAALALAHFGGHL